MIRIFIAAAVAIFAVPTYALNWSGFKDAPITRLGKEELQAFLTVVNKTLDDTPDGTTVEWKATKATFNSKITPRKSFTEGTAKCREATVESDSGDRFARGDYVFCKGGKGSWQFKSPAAKKPAPVK